MSFQIHDSWTTTRWPCLLVRAQLPIAVGVLLCGLWSSAIAQPKTEKPPTAPTRKADLVEDPIPLFSTKESVQLFPKFYYSAALSSDDHWFAGGVGDWTTTGEILVWDTVSRQRIIRHTLGRGIRSLAFSPDGKLLAAGSFTNEVMIVEIPTGAIIARWIAHSGGVNGLTFSRDGKLLATASLDKTVKLWTMTRPADPAQGLPALATFDGHSDWVFTVAFSHDGKTLYSAGREQRVFVWDVENQIPKNVWNNLPAGVESVAVSPDGNTVALGLWDGTVELRKPDDGAVTAKLEHMPDGAYTVCMVSFSKDGKSLVSSAVDGTAKVWDFPAGELRTTIKAHAGRAWGALLTADASQLFTAGSDGYVRIWDTKTSQRLQQFPDDQALAETTNPITAVSWQNDPSTVLTAHSDRSVRIRDSASGRTLQMVVAPTEIVSLATSPDARMAIGAGKNHNVYLFELGAPKSGTMNAPVALKGHKTDVTSVVFSSNDAQAFSADSSGIIQQWDVVGRKAGRVFEAGNDSILCLARSDDGKWLAAGNIRGDIQLWSLAAGSVKPVAVLHGHTSNVTAVAFASRARILVSGGADRQALVWMLDDLKTDPSGNSDAGLQPKKLLGHSDAVSRLALSPHGTWLVTGGEDKTVRVWDTRTAALIKTITNPNSCRSLAIKSDMLLNVRTDKFLDIWSFKPIITFPKAEGRYVKLKALSAIQYGDPYASVAEINLFHASQLISNSGWKVVSVDSDNKGNEARLAIDGNPATFWHTQWQTNSPRPHPHELVIDLGHRFAMTGLCVVSRTDDSRNGTIKDFEFYVSDDPQKFDKPAIGGELNSAVQPKP